MIENRRSLRWRDHRGKRCLFGFPAPDDPYWNEQTVADVAIRYPQMDMTPYVR